MSLRVAARSCTTRTRHDPGLLGATAQLLSSRLILYKYQVAWCEPLSARADKPLIGGDTGSLNPDSPVFGLKGLLDE